MGRGDYIARTKGGYGSGSSTQNRNTGQSGGQSGGPPGRGDTGPSQAAIESARRANEASAARRAAEPVRETWRDDPEKVDEWDPSQDIIDRQEKARLDALDAMNQRMADMDKAQKMAYSTQQIGWGSTDPNDPNYNPDATAKDVSNLHNLSDEELQFLIDSGFAASEASGVLGGTMGLEVEVNKLKKTISDPYSSNEEYNAALAAMDKLNANIGGWKATDKQMQMGALDHDPSAVYTWGDVESTSLQGYDKDDPRNLYQAHTDLLSSSLTPDKYKTHMKNISAFGHPFPTTGSGDGGWTDYGWGQGGGGGGGGTGYYGDPRRGNPVEQMAGFYTPQANLQQAMVNVHQTPTVFKKRGGIVSLLRLN